MSYHPHVFSHPRKAPLPILAEPLLRQRQIERDQYTAFLSTQPMDDQDLWEPAGNNTDGRLFACLLTVVFFLCQLITAVLATPHHE